MLYYISNTVLWLSFYLSLKKRGTWYKLIYSLVHFYSFIMLLITLLKTICLTKAFRENIFKIRSCWKLSDVEIIWRDL